MLAQLVVFFDIVTNDVHAFDRTIGLHVGQKLHADMTLRPDQCQ